MTRLEHLGIAVRDPEAAAHLYHVLIGRTPYKSETVEREGVRTHFVSAASEGAPLPPKLEFLESLAPDSPVGRYLSKRGPGLHHVAFEVDDLPTAIARARAAGLALLADAPKPGADGKEIIFLHPKSTGGVLVELMQKPEAAH